MDIKECLNKGFLRKIKSNPDLIKKEFKEAEYDLNKAEHALEENDFKWCIVKSYYSMFHAARAVLFKLGLKERRHFAIQIVLENLVKEGKLENIHLEYFSAALESREGADYRYEYSNEIAKYIIENAEKFLSRMKQLIK